MHRRPSQRAPRPDGVRRSLRDSADAEGRDSALYAEDDRKDAPSVRWEAEDLAPPVYVAVYERDPWSPAWNVWVEGAPGVHTFGTRLAQARANVRDALALWLDVDASSLEIDDDIRLPRDVRKHVYELESAREQFDEARNRVTIATAQAARALVDAGLSMRDIAHVLDLSHQRISQVVE